MRAVTLGGVVASLAVQSLVAQTIRVGEEIPVAAEAGQDIVEAHLSVSPTDREHLVGAAMVLRTFDFEVIDCTIVASFDGGRTWSRHDLGLSSCGDPWTLITETGTALVSVLSEREMLVFRSDDGGRTWSGAPFVIPGGFDHEMMVGGTKDDPIYLVSSVARRSPGGALRSAIHVAMSTDDGRTFSDHSEVILSNLSYEAMTPVVSSDGTLLVPFQDHHRSGGGRVVSRRSWLLAFEGEEGAAPPRLIDEGCNRVGPVGWPTMAVYAPGLYSDRLLWACEREEARGIAIRRSDDLGETWSEGIGIGVAAEAAWTKVPGLAVSSSDVALATWAAPAVSGRDCLVLWGAASTDGGESFGEQQRLSGDPSCRVESDVWARFPAGGDYSGIVPVGDNEFQALWADGRNGRFQLYSRRVTVSR